MSRKRRRNGHHPIWAAIGTILVEGVAGAVVNAVAHSATESMAAKVVVSAGVPVGGYFVGAKMFPAYKTPILVGSIISLVFHGIGAAATAKALPAPKAT